MSSEVQAAVSFDNTLGFGYDEDASRMESFQKHSRNVNEVTEPWPPEDLSSLTPAQIKEKELDHFRGTETWQNAVVALRNRLKEQGEWSETVRLVEEKGNGEFPISHHLMGGGMYIRNQLRDLGYGEEDIGAVNLDNIYAEIVEEAVAGD